MFKKRNWTKWEHVMFVEDFRAGISTYEILMRTDTDTGLTEYRKVYVKDCVHSLCQLLTNWWNNKQQTKN